MALVPRARLAALRKLRRGNDLEVGIGVLIGSRLSGFGSDCLAISSLVALDLDMA